MENKEIIKAVILALRRALEATGIFTLVVVITNKLIPFNILVAAYIMMLVIVSVNLLYHYTEMSIFNIGIIAYVVTLMAIIGFNYFVKTNFEGIMTTVVFVTIIYPISWAIHHRHMLKQIRTMNREFKKSQAK
ncbi:MAG: hypothetical protein LBT37_03345 [Lactobacillaceae bacterium]|jgi:hypothetical protein|nr:hypothetical protein [Lactobacillaceae bacterium]